MSQENFAKNKLFWFLILLAIVAVVGVAFMMRKTENTFLNKQQQRIGDFLSEGDQENKGSPSSEDTIKIGYISPFRDAYDEIQIQPTVSIALEDVHSESELRFEVVTSFYEELTKEKIMENYNELTRDNDIKIIITHSMSIPPFLLEKARQDNIALINASSFTEEFRSGEESNNLFAIGRSPAGNAELLVDHCVDRGYEDVVIFTMGSSGYYTRTADIFADDFSGNTSVYYYNHENQEEKVENAINEIQGDDVDVIMTLSIGPNMDYWEKGEQSNDIIKKIINNGIEPQEFLVLDTPKVDSNINTPIVVSRMNFETGEMEKSFNKRFYEYNEKYLLGETEVHLRNVIFSEKFRRRNFVVYPLYDAIKISAKAIEDSLQGGRDIASSLKSVEIKGIAGDINFQNDNIWEIPASLHGFSRIR
jgi:hypothetical protein